VNADPYDNSIPKYSTAIHIYDSLYKMVKTEEMGILAEIGMDVSYDNQSYYYTDKGNELIQKFKKLSDYGDKMWLMNLAILQIDRSNIHDTVFEALNNDDLAKRIGFKKLFIEHMLQGDKTHYKEISEEYECELRELNCFDNWSMSKAFLSVMSERGKTLIATPYPNFIYYLNNKIWNLHLHEHTCLIAECRAHLTSYDDFMHGLQVNQSLYEVLERSFQSKLCI